MAGNTRTFLNKLNGWQRIWVTVSIPWLAFTLFLSFAEAKIDNLVLGVVCSLLLLLFGYSVAWIIKGFKK